MNILEKDIEELVHEACKTNPGILYERGLSLDILFEWPVVLRQHNLGGYGIMDITMISYNPLERSYSVNVLELKKDEINYKTIDQGIRYRKGIEHYFNEYYPGITADIKITLIGREIDFESSACYIPEYMPDISFYTYSLDLLAGLKFEHKYGYRRTKPEFKKPSKELQNAVKSHVYHRTRRYYNG